MCCCWPSQPPRATAFSKPVVLTHRGGREGRSLPYRWQNRSHAYGIGTHDLLIMRTECDYRPVALVILPKSECRWWCQVLDIHSNQMSTLSDVNIGGLQMLQVLNLENNRLHSLPASIGMLSSLQTLNLRGARCPVIFFWGGGEFLEMSGKGSLESRGKCIMSEKSRILCSWLWRLGDMLVTKFIINM